MARETDGVVDGRHEEASDPTHGGCKGGGRRGSGGTLMQTTDVLITDPHLGFAVLVWGRRPATRSRFRSRSPPRTRDPRRDDRPSIRTVAELIKQGPATIP